MENDNVLPLKVGLLPKECYESWQEFANDLAKILSLPQDNKEIIQGAIGPEGPKGSAGARGAKGDTGPGFIVSGLSYAIDSGVTFIEIDYFPEYQSAFYHIFYNGQYGSEEEDVEDFVPSNGYIGVGTIVEVFAAGTPTKLRVYFTFAGGITATPDEFFILRANYQTLT